MHPLSAQTPRDTGAAADRQPVLDRYAFNERAADWRLSNRVREISGLAHTSDGRLLAHDDERAVIYEIDITTGDVIKGWAFGDTPARGDFEGIAVVADRVWLVTSDGRLYEGAEGEDDERVLFNTYGTGVGRKCEVEGLAYEPMDETLLLACKTPRTPELEGVVAIYRWSIASRALIDPPIRIRKEEILKHLDRSDFHPSGIARDPQSHHYVMVAARQAALAEIRADGSVVAVRALQPRVHPQAEGIVISSDLTLLVADEGAARRARLRLFAPKPH